MEKKTKVVVLGLVFNDAGQILLTRRHDPDIVDAHLLWDIPGGTNEFEERLEDTAKREVLEETGAEVEVGELMPRCVTKTWNHKNYLQHTLVFCYRCKLVSEHTAEKDAKIAAVKWENTQNLAGYTFLPTTHEFIKLAFPAKI